MTPPRYRSDTDVLSRPISTLLPPLALAAVLGLGLALTGLAARAGAHPFWAGTVPLIGLAPAAALILIWMNRPRLAFGIAAFFAIGGGLSAHYGKAAFAASFAENAAAGRAWYVGWILLCAGAIALVSLSFAAIWPARARP